MKAKIYFTVDYNNVEEELKKCFLERLRYHTSRLVTKLSTGDIETSKYIIEELNYALSDYYSQLAEYNRIVHENGSVPEKKSYCNCSDSNELNLENK